MKLHFAIVSILFHIKIIFGQTSELVLNHVSLRHLDVKNCGLLSSNRIAHGNETSLFEFPWMALLQYDDQSGLRFKCGGSVINKRFILTAAHCVSNLRSGIRLVSVRLGEYDISQNIDCQVQDGERVCAPAVQDIPIDRTIAHPGFNNPRYANDIALVKLSKDADFNDFAVRSICLPITNELIYLPLKTLIVTGWGATGSSRRSDILLKANVSYVENQPCESALRIKLSPGQFCAGGEGLVARCGGDAGGPLQFIAGLQVTKVVHIGVSSFGVHGCEENETKPSVYSDIRYYMKWILDNIDAA